MYEESWRTSKHDVNVLLTPISTAVNAGGQLSNLSVALGTFGDV